VVGAFPAANADCVNAVSDGQRIALAVLRCEQHRCCLMESGNPGCL
jgi:hypothetical protein